MSYGILKRWAVIILFLSHLPVHGQQDLSAASWHYMDSMIARRKNLTDLSAALYNLEQKARQEQRYLQLARCQYYQVLITDQKTEDSFYFKNSAILDEALLQQQSPVYSFALHLLLAKRLAAFTARRSNAYRKKYERNDIPVNYAVYSISQIDSIAALHLETAKSLGRQLTGEDISDALWLSSDPYQFLFKPGFFDIAIAEQVVFSARFRNLYGNTLQSDSVRTWLQLTPDAFIAAIDSASRQPGNYFKELTPYSEWISYHKNEPATYYFLESVVRKFIASQAGRFGTDKKLYENYLVTQSRSPYSTVRAHVVYQLCLLWNKQGENYFPGGVRNWDYELQDYIGANRTEYDTTWQYYPLKAQELFIANKNMLDSFAYLKAILLRMEASILQTSMQLTLDNTVLPDEPVLTQLKFKNAGAFYYRVVSLGSDYISPVTADKELITAFLRHPVVLDSVIPLPALTDHNRHLAYINIGKLPAGHYAIVFSAKPFTEDGDRFYCRFAATNVAIVNNDRRVYILHRKTGLPLAGAAVSAHYAEQINTGGVPEFKHYYTRLQVNSRGYVLVPGNKYRDLTVYYGTDTSREANLDYHEPETPDDVYSKEEYDDLVDFYEENAKAAIYTDRAIYRPGQTVYYKAIFYTKNKLTGEQMIMNRQNLKGKLWGSVYSKWLKESAPLLNITDPFGKIKDSLKVTLNEFGSVSGSFTIPQNAATGEWEIEPDYIDKEWDFGRFKVEEYKRPTYEVAIEKPKKELKPGDTFPLRVKVKSFAGASLSQVEISYSITRSGDIPVYDSVLKRTTPQYLSQDIIDTVGYTNDKGELEIVVDDSLVRQKAKDKNFDWNISYSFNAEAVDETGESYEADERINISSRPVRIRIPVNETYERKSLAALPISTSDENAGPVGKQLLVKVYRVARTEWPFSNRRLIRADTWLYDKQALQQVFPFENILGQTEKTDSVLLFEKEVNTAIGEKLELNEDRFPAGYYAIRAVCVEDGVITGEVVKAFAVTDYGAGQMPGPAFFYHYLPFNAVSPGSKLELYYGNAYQAVYSILNVSCKSGRASNPAQAYYEERNDAAGLKHYQFNVPSTATGRMAVAHIVVFNNQVYNYTQYITVTKPPASEPEIIIEKYRKILTPGAKETFVVSVKTKNENTAAELMTTLYDASLDKLEKLQWRFPRKDSYSPVSMGWHRYINQSVSNLTDVYDVAYYRGSNFTPSNPVWWSAETRLPAIGRDINDMNYADDRLKAGFGFDMSGSTRFDGDGLAGKVAGLNITSTEGLNEVVVTALGVKVSAKALSASVVTIRGATSLVDYNQPLVILDGVIYTGDIHKLDIKTITAGMVLKGADAVAIYGSAAANGVLVLSTKGEIVLPAVPEPEPVVRKNFAETAFFFPAVHADRDGFYSFTFTMPESVTEWNWKLLAHTKSAFFTLAERKLNTQLPLMVQPAMPRLLYQGDHILLQSRISNLDTADNSGVIQCKFEDVVTGNDITAKLLSTAKQNFSVNKRSNTVSGFDIRVPDGQLNPLRVTVTVRTPGFADGEEHVIPVLSPRIFVRESRPFLYTVKADTVLQLPSLPAGSSMYGIGLSLQPQPAAALINSLPHLATYPYSCAEQTFNKLMAYNTAIQLMQKDTSLQHSFETAKSNTGNSGAIPEVLPDDLAEETMPWLTLNNHAAGTKQKLFNLLDTAQSKMKAAELRDKLFKLQNSNGGLSWFSGGESDLYISCYVLRGFGFMQHAGMKSDALSGSGDYDHIKRIISYTDQQLPALFAMKNKSSLLYYAYARSYWNDKYPQPDSVFLRIQQYLLHEFKEADERSLYQQALLVIAGFRYAAGKDSAALYNEATDLLKSVYQQAISDPQQGVRWKELADTDDLSYSAEETITLLAEAFETGKAESINKGIVQWLLGAKSEHGWSSTKATAAAVNLLLKTVNDRSEVQTVTMNAGESKTICSNDLLSGNGFNFIKTGNDVTGITLQKQQAGTAQGSVMQYYFSREVPAALQNGNTRLEKLFYVWNEKANDWKRLATGDSLHIADKIKVTLTIENRTALPYVFIDDKRAALFEPADISSGYEYSQGFSYYKSVRDAGFQFFANNIPSGLHSISYEMKVAQQGTFFSGPAVLQCMYRPDVTAYSSTSSFSAVK